MPINILMPALSPTMTEGNLAKWHVKEGDSVTSGDIIAEIETDKATMEVEAVDEGTVGKILVAEGAEAVAVNTPIAIILEEGEEILAMSRYDVDRATRLADIAFVVRDDWQRRGIGSLLMMRMSEIARSRGLAGFTADVMGSNKAMLMVFNKSGMKVESSVDGNVYHLRMLFDGPVKGNMGRSPQKLTVQHQHEPTERFAAGVATVI